MNKLVYEMCEEILELGEGNDDEFDCSFILRTDCILQYTKCNDIITKDMIILPQKYIDENKEEYDKEKGE